MAYEPAIRLTIRHEYYSPADGARRFHVEPVGDTLVNLRERGILVRAEREDVLVVRDVGRRPVRRPDGGAGSITLAIHGADEEFACVSDVDLSVGAARECLYFTNQRNDDAGGAAAGVERVLPARLMPILPRAIALPIEPGQTVEVLNGAGERVMSTSAPAKASSPVVGNDPAIRYDPTARRVWLDLSGQPSGRYVIRVVDRQVSEGLLLPRGRVPAAFLDLALPAAGECERAAVVFRARRTYWKYNVVSRPGGGPLDGLSIATATNGAPRGEALPTFLGPFEETLPNGARTYQFLSAAPMALASRSGVRLRLTGRRKDRMTREGVLVDCLPVPAKHQLALLTSRDVERLGTDQRFCSEMFIYV